MKKKLLVIEDEKSVAKQLRWGRDDEYEITIAANAEQAKPLLVSGLFPVATLDLGFPPSPDTPQQGFALLEKIASLAPHTRVIVITGNAGTGKEMAAQAVHSLSPRAAENLIIINCRVIPENLLESELFGHEKGAFTGAASRHRSASSNKQMAALYS
jgi:DNA-binding NtrC family response regulator